ncbi:MAG: MBL fold metallo-hydrolase, partial [Dehalococcoidia bacterium]|nr:MBL fold metallo-hydrolase [Dehalococcoidia bacterium]
HDTSRGRERGKNTMFVFAVDGMRISHVGDLGHQLTDQQLAELGSVDVLLVPVGGFYTIDASEATRLVERLGPRVVIPMHYRTARCLFPISGVEDFIEGKKNVRKAATSEVELKKDTLPAEMEIIVLEHAL